jgi:hypothetical protein
MILFGEKMKKLVQIPRKMQTTIFFAKKLKS